MVPKMPSRSRRFTKRQRIVRWTSSLTTQTVAAAPSKRLGRHLMREKSSVLNPHAVEGYASTQ